ncbi:MAG: hypothetical protein QW478_07720 [Candidatus Micrarchaeaceae archaeon]
MPSNKALILDTNAIITGLPSMAHDAEVYVTTEIFHEVKRMDQQGTVLENIHYLHIIDPTSESVLQVMEAATRLGESLSLSKADISLLALALELSNSQEVEIISDDYSIENLASYLGLKCKSLSTHGITHAMKWKFYCKGCKKEYLRPPSSGICLICGSKIVRRPISKKAVEKKQ